MGKTEFHTHTNESRSLLATLLLNLLISLAEIIGGILSNSLALVSDALHNFSDGIAVGITYISMKISGKESNSDHTFGYKRIQILAALFNAVSLIAICVFLLFEAYHRFIHPEPIQSSIMFWVATLGLIANLVGVHLLRKFAGSNLNIKAAYLHLIGDSLSSVAVIVGGIIIYYFDFQWIDPLITVLISLYIILETWKILAETYQILMQATPKSMDIQCICNELCTIPEVANIHHVHLWSLTDKQVHFEAHLELVNDLRISESQNILKEVKKILKEKFDIQHITIQTEFRCCNENHFISLKH